MLHTYGVMWLFPCLTPRLDHRFHEAGGLGRFARYCVPSAYHSVAHGEYALNKGVDTALCPPSLLSSLTCSLAHFADGHAEALGRGAICPGSQSEFMGLLLFHRLRISDWKEPCKLFTSKLHLMLCPLQQG